MNTWELLLTEKGHDELFHQRVNGLTRLLEVTRLLAAEVDLTKTLQAIADEACDALVCERSSLFLYDAKRQELYTQVVTELEVSEIRKGIEHGISGFAARERQMVNVPDPPRDPRWNPEIDLATGYQTRSILAAPLISSRDGALLGVLECLNNKGGPFDRFDEQLLEAFCQHAAVALDRARLVCDLKERQAIDLALNVARDVQLGFMPRELPEIEGYELATWWCPHQAIGADYFDAVPMRDGRVGLVIADVSGHGLGPSLIMASARAALRVLLLEHCQPELLLEMLGRAIAPDLKNSLFITLIVGALDPREHTFQFANAGHAPAEHFSAASGVLTALEATGLPLGVLDDAEYSAGPLVHMAPGDLIVLCTDGIVEATDAEGRPFGNARLQATIEEFHDAPAQELAQRIGERVEAYYEGDSPADDLTILIARRKGGPATRAV